MGIQNISLCMIVKNEARLITECLLSAKDFCSELIVIDTGSTDDTIALAKAAGADVYEHPWPGHFSKARNISLDYARGDWILILDGDEVLDVDSLKHLNNIEVSDNTDAFEFQIVNFSTDDATEDNAHFQQQVRLFRNRPNHRYAGLIHNQLVNVETGEGLDGPFIPIRVLHYGYTPTVWAAQNKAKRLSMLESALAENPESLFCHYNLANHLKILGEHARALAHYAACFDGDRERVWVQMAFFSAAFCANQIGKHTLAIECAEQLLETHPQVADAHLRRAEALLGLERPDLVVALLEPVVGHPELVAFKTYTNTFALPYRLGRAYFLTQDFEKALHQFIPLADHTDDVTVFTHICICALHLKNLELAQSAYDAGVQLAPDEPDWVKLGELLQRALTTENPKS